MIDLILIIFSLFFDFRIITTNIPRHFLPTCVPKYLTLSNSSRQLKKEASQVSRQEGRREVGLAVKYHYRRISLTYHNIVLPNTRLVSRHSQVYYQRVNGPKENKGVEWSLEKNDKTDFVSHFIQVYKYNHTVIKSFCTAA